MVAAMPRVRAALIEAQRAFAARPGGAVLDGRDIGTVICPDADVKIFVTAGPAARAQRRALESSDAAKGPITTRYWPISTGATPATPTGRWRLYARPPTR